MDNTNNAKKPTDYLLRTLKESKKDIKKKQVSPSFNNADEAIKWLESPEGKKTIKI